MKPWPANQTAGLPSYLNDQSKPIPITSTSDVPVVLSSPILLYLCHSARTPRFLLMSKRAPRPYVHPLLVAEAFTVAEPPPPVPVAVSSMVPWYPPNLANREN